MRVLAVVLVFALLAVALSVAVLVTRKASLGGLSSSSGGGFAPALVPSPGLLYNRSNGTVTYVQSMLFSSMKQMATPDYSPSLGDLLSVVGGEVVWDPPFNLLGNTWLGGDGTGTDTQPDTYAPCPAGMAATGIRVYGESGSTTAAAVAPLCEPMLTIGQNTPVRGDVLDHNGVAVDLGNYVSRDYAAKGLYLTARNFLHGDGGGWQGNLLMDQTGSQDLGSAEPPGWFMAGVQFQSIAVRGGNSTDPWKPTGTDGGDGGNYHVNLQMTILYYKVGDTQADPREFPLNVWQYAYNAHRYDSGANGWQYTSTPQPLTTAFQYDASRTIKVDYGSNGGVGVFKGLAVKADSVKVMPGAGVTDGNVAQLVYYPDPSTNPDMQGFQYSCGFKHNHQSGDPSPNYEIGFNLDRSTAFPADYLLTVTNTTADAFITQAKQARLTVLQPTCTGVLPKPGSNPITEQTLGESLPANQAACATHARQLCAALGDGEASSPYCDCINSTPIPALEQIGINLPLHCMSNGPCMGAVPTETWMDYDHVDNCEKLSLDVCGAMYQMSARTIVLANDRFQCSNDDKRCPECDAGIGTCKAIEPVTVNGVQHTACRPKNNGECGAGFVDCAPDPDPGPGPGPGPPDPTAALSKEERIAIGAAVAIVLLLLVTAGVHRLRKKQ